MTDKIMTIPEVKRAIKYYVHPDRGRSDLYLDYENWYCGITNNTKTRKAAHKYTKGVSARYFQFWNLATKEDAILVEKFFHVKGMEGKARSSGGAKDNSTYVYIYKLHTNILDGIASLFE